jgi:ketosteroid isomerase-like protein
MSEENVDLFKRAFREFDRGGWEAVKGTFWHPDVAWDMRPTGIPGLGLYQGVDEVTAFMEEWFGAFPFDSWTQDLDDVADAGDRVLALVRQHGRGSASGVGVELEYAQLVEFKAGLIVRTTVYLDREEAFRAAGLEG